MKDTGDLMEQPYDGDPDLLKKYQKLEELFRQARGGKGGGTDEIKIPNLNITRLLGHGMGKVYLAHDTSLDRQVAVKVIPKMDNEQVLKRFQQESKILAKFTHPNIVVIYSHGETDEFYYYVMQYLEGLTLDKVVRHIKENRFSRASDVFDVATGRMADLPPKNRVRTILDADYINAVVNIARQACDGLDAAHRARVIHRDVKPQNILYDTHGMIKLMDFGISKLAESSVRTRTSEVLGTPYYISPEMIRKKEIGEQTDVYALGVVLYELLALRVPFEEETLDRLYHSILETPAPDLRSFSPDVPPPLAELVQSCLKKNPADRYRNMKELKSDLERVADSGAGGRPRQRVESAEPTGRRDCGESDFARLLRFYQSCIEEEDKHALKLERAQYGQSFISPWKRSEPLLHPGSPEVRFQVDTGELSFVTRGAARAGPAERFFYGYPIFLDARDFVTPLFMLEVELVVGSGGACTMRPVDPNAVMVNHHVLLSHGHLSEQLPAILSELEGLFGSFEARLRAALDHLRVDPQPFRHDRLEPLPDGGAVESRWVNKPILFRSERNLFTYNLKKEMDELLGRDDLLKNVMGTALAPILAPGQSHAAPPMTESSVPVLEVLPLNDQQELAALAGLTKPITVVTGPPGTGKSQVVVNLLASCAAAGKAVLFASKNNKAVDVVHERLNAILEEDDWTLRLGSKAKMEETSADMLRRLSSIGTRPNVTSDLDATAVLKGIDEKLQTVRQEMKQLGEMREQVQAAVEKMSKAAETVPPEWTDSTDLSNLPAIPEEPLRRGVTESRALAGRGLMGFILWIRRLFARKRLLRELTERLTECARPLPAAVQDAILRDVRADVTFSTLADAFQKLSDYASWVNARNTYRLMLKKLGSLPTANSLLQKWQKLKHEKSTRSRDFLRMEWTGRIRAKWDVAHQCARRFFDLSSRPRSGNSPQARRLMEDFSRTIKSLGPFLPVWIVTNLSVRRSMPLEPALFDLVIIDEASQCDIPSAIPLLFRAKRALIIGDPNQLRHISAIRYQREEYLAHQQGAEDLLTDWSFVRCSLYDVAAAAVVGRDNPPIFLAEHYRSHPDVIEFSNRVFYQGRLVLRTAVSALEKKVDGQKLGVFWHDVKGRVPETSRGAWNKDEIEAAIHLLNLWHGAGLLANRDLTFGIVTPFRAQMEKLGEAVQKQPWWEEVKGRLTVGTAHQFQGDECDLMIFSPVISDGIREKTAGWVAKTDQLLNVAVTRARAALHVVGNMDACKNAGGYIGEFADYVSSGHVAGHSEADIRETSESRMAELLRKAGLWFHHHFKEGRDELDFLVVSPFGTRYDLEVDGKQHNSPEQIRSDNVRDKRIEATGYKVVRVSARDVFNSEPAIVDLLLRLT